MKTKILMAAIIASLVLGVSSCAYVDPRTQYPPVYRTYQDRDHGGMDVYHGGQNKPY
jgi:hypothetical protein